MTVLVFAVLRLAWRLYHKPPQLPVGMSWSETKLAAATHAAFYVLLFSMPLTGWLMSSAKNYSVSWFGLLTWPNLISKNESAFDALREIHDVLSWFLLGLAILHVLAALKHHFVGKDDVLRRMLPSVSKEKRTT